MFAYGSCRVSDQGTTLRGVDRHNARATILIPLIHAFKHVLIKDWLNKNG